MGLFFCLKSIADIQKVGINTPPNNFQQILQVTQK